MGEGKVMKANQRGLTLIEVIISLLIFTLVMVLFVNIMMTATGISKSANDIAKESMEGITILEQGKGDKVEGLPSEIKLNFGKEGTKKEVILKGDYRIAGDKASKYVYFDTTETSQTP